MVFHELVIFSKKSYRFLWTNASSPNESKQLRTPQTLNLTQSNKLRIFSFYKRTLCDHILSWWLPFVFLQMYVCPWTIKYPQFSNIAWIVIPSHNFSKLTNKNTRKYSSSALIRSTSWNCAPRLFSIAFFKYFPIYFALLSIYSLAALPSWFLKWKGKQVSLIKIWMIF